MAEVQGTCDVRFEAVRETLRANLEGEELGASIAINLDGRTLLDIWGGWGGSVIIMDLERKLTLAYMMNRMGAGIIGSARAESYVRATYAALGVELQPPAMLV